MSKTMRRDELPAGWQSDGGANLNRCGIGGGREWSHEDKQLTCRVELVEPDYAMYPDEMPCEDIPLNWLVYLWHPSDSVPRQAIVESDNPDDAIDRAYQMIRDEGE